MIAHQWRQPLGAISASTFALQLKAVSPKLDFSKEEDRSVFITFLDETLDKVGENVQFLSTTIDDFRTFFQSDKKMQTVPFKEPLSRALKIVEASLQTHNIELIIDIKSERTILMYPNELMQVILNIIKNAEDVLMYNNIEEPKIKLVIHDTSDGVTLDIIDNGKGIEEKIIDHIFDPYFSTKDEKNGTGLGLYMSKMMIEDHNHGTLEVRNIDDGVCFSITLKAS
jgi:signal transduction histidine kinase